jgi:hypothetical protein
MSQLLYSLWTKEWLHPWNSATRLILLLLLMKVTA